MPRRGVLENRHAVQRRAENVALTHEADQVVGGIVEADRTKSILAGSDHQVAVVEVWQRNFVGMGLLMKPARRIGAVVDRIFPFGDQVDLGGARAMDPEPAHDEGIERLRRPPAGQRIERDRAGRPAHVFRLQLAVGALRMMLGVELDEFGVPDRLLHRVNQREQMRRRQHPVAALRGALDDVGDHVGTAAWPEVLTDRGRAGERVEIFPDPLPDAHQPQIERRNVAAQRNDCRHRLRQADGQHATRGVPGWRS